MNVFPGFSRVQDPRGIINGALVAQPSIFAVVLIGRSSEVINLWMYGAQARSDAHHKSKHYHANLHHANTYWLSGI